VERTRLLVHVLDIAPELTGEEQADAVANHMTIERELAAHDERLARLPRVLALSKADLVTAEREATVRKQWQERLGDEVPVIVTSSATGEGVAVLAGELLRRVGALSGTSAGRAGAGGEHADVEMDGAPRAGGADGEEELAEHMVFRPAAGSGFVVEQVGPGSFAVKGRGVERLLARFDVENDDAMAYLEGRLRKIGVVRALEAEGFQPGDEIEIAGVILELDHS
jgi:GTPase